MAAQASRHRKRLSAIRLSSDTTTSLPAYSSPISIPPASASEWPSAQPSHPQEDQPPDYPQSAEEADQEDDFVPRPTAPKRHRHRRANSVPSSPSVDDLLERSVVALELSTNALLQSMDTQSSLSVLANDQILERSLDRQTRMLNLRLRGSRSAHEGWMDDLNELVKGVDSLCSQEGEDGAVSRSLPTGSSHIPRHRRRDLPKSNSESAYLHLSTSELDLRETLRPPRALTQYVSVESSLGDACEATADSESIYLPSTTGLRSAAHIRSFVGTAPRPHRLRQSHSSPGPNLHSMPSSPAFNKLSHFTSHRSSRSSSHTRAVSPHVSKSSPSTPDVTSRKTHRRYSAGSMDSNFAFPTGLHRSRSTSRGRSSASTETPSLPPVRAMTPPMEEITPSSSSESTSSHRNVHAFRTMQCLRKILNEAPLDPKGKRPAARLHARPPRPNFQPRTPSVAASSSTSTATASVSRLLTRSSHHASQPTPRQSSLKHSRSALSTPLTSDSPEHGSPSSRLSSAASTPRQVSFAELPDSYSGRPWRKDKDRDKERGQGKGRKGKDQGSWWRGWFTGVGGSGMGAARYDERMEDRVMRGWGRAGAGGGLTDEWML